jgi:hypothetical protein
MTNQEDAMLRKAMLRKVVASVLLFLFIRGGCSSTLRKRPYTFLLIHFLLLPSYLESYFE